MTLFENQQVVAGRFTLVSLLGSGGMGRVYRVKDGELEVEVALKVLNSEEEVLVNRLRNELVVARKLTHPNIVRLHDFGRTEDGRVFISMEYVAGESLRERLQRAKLRSAIGGKQLQSGLLLPEAISVVKHIALGLQYAHSKGVVHRDIKPENVLISSDGEVKIADFGLARNLQLSAGLTVDGQTVGTPYYMAPEQVRGEKVGPAADLYALGIVAFELCTGEPPFDGDNPMAVAYKHLNAAPPLDQLAPAGAPAWLIDIIKHLLEKDPEKRPKSVDQVLDAMPSARGATPHLKRGPSGLDEGALDDEARRDTVLVPVEEPSIKGLVGQKLTVMGMQSIQLATAGARVATPVAKRWGGIAGRASWKLLKRIAGLALALLRAGGRRSLALPRKYLAAGVGLLALVLVGSFALTGKSPERSDNTAVSTSGADSVQGGASVGDARALDLNRNYIISPSKTPQLFTLNVPSGNLLIGYVQPADQATGIDVQFQTKGGVTVDSGSAYLSSNETRTFVVHSTREMNGEAVMVINCGHPVAFRGRLEPRFDADSSMDAGAFSGDAITLETDRVISGNLPDEKDFDTYRFDSVTKGPFVVKVRPSDFAELRANLLDEEGMELASGESKNAGAMVTLKVDNPRQQSMFVKLTPVGSNRKSATYSLVGGSSPASPEPPEPAQRLPR